MLGGIYMKFIILLVLFITTPLLSKEAIIKINQLSLSQEQTWQAEKIYKDYYKINISKLEYLMLKKQNVKIQWSQKAEKRNLISNERMEIFQFQNEIFDFLFNDPLIHNQWYLRDSLRFGAGFFPAYSKSFYLLDPVIVAVVDTGVDYNHEDLSTSMWKNTNEIPNDHIDNDLNGYIDDVYGIDLLNINDNNEISGDPMDQHNHGTHVSGIIAAQINNNIGISGITNNAKIMAIRAVPSSGDETDSDIMKAFSYAAQMGAKIINCSFGKYPTDDSLLVEELMQDLGNDYGVLFITSAGNNGANLETKKLVPASFNIDNLIVVANSTAKGHLSFMSNYSPNLVHIAAPGTGIHSTIRNNEYISYNGTSMASPVVAGVAAELMARFPQLTHLEIKDIVLNSSTNEEKLKTRVITSGRVDLFNAIQYAEENFN